MAFEVDEDERNFCTQSNDTEIKKKKVPDFTVKFFLF